MTHPFRSGWPAVLLLAVFVVPRAWAHPLGPFAIDHYSRIQVTRVGLSVHYIIDMAEVPTLEELSNADRDRDGKISDAEEQDYLQTKVRDFARNLRIEVNRRALEWRTDSSSLTGLRSNAPEGSRSFPTIRIVTDLSASIPKDIHEIKDVRYRDENFPRRAGWKEIVVNPSPDLQLTNSSVPAEDLSAELTRYPSDALVAPPQFLQAELRFGSGIDASGNISLPALVVSLLTTTAVLIARRKRKPKRVLSDRPQSS
jgi:hypothetical protein